MSKLLVIGNGFDLSLNAKTSYSEFFQSDYYAPKIKLIEGWINRVNTLKYDSLNSIFDNSELDFSCWDLLFYFKSQKGNPLCYTEESIRWCDIEQVIHDSLISLSTGFTWDQIFNFLNIYYLDGAQILKDNIYDRPLITKVIFFFILKNNWNDCVNNKERFYKRLVEELRSFEIGFGQYINNATNNQYYKDTAITFADKLANTKVSKIDSFNYSNLYVPYDRKIQIRHINGNVSNPIFGIDVSPGKAGDFPKEYRLFTKTSRRIYQDAYGISAESDLKQYRIDSALIYGHSLNMMDYDYFNYLFTRLKINTFDPDEMGTVEFVYNIYDENRALEIREENSESVYQLINKYEESIGRNSQHLLLNLLRFSGKLKLYEINVNEVLNKPSVIGPRMFYN